MIPGFARVFDSCFGGFFETRVLHYEFFLSVKSVLQPNSLNLDNRLYFADDFGTQHEKHYLFRD